MGRGVCNTGFPQSLLEENGIDAYRKLGKGDKKEDLQKKMGSLSRVVIEHYYIPSFVYIYPSFTSRICIAFYE
jgi:hypothetical protein